MKVTIITSFPFPNGKATANRVRTFAEQLIASSNIKYVDIVCCSQENNKTYFFDNNIKVINIKSKKVKWIILLSKKGAANFSRLINKYLSIDYFSDIKFARLSSNIASELSNHIPHKFFPRKPSLNSLKCVIIKNG